MSFAKRQELDSQYDPFRVAVKAPAEALWGAGLRSSASYQRVHHTPQDEASTPPPYDCGGVAGLAKGLEAQWHGSPGADAPADFAILSAENWINGGEAGRGR